MTRSQENDGVECLNMIPGEVRFFGNPLKDAQGQRLKVPHMGWNEVHQHTDHPLWAGIPDMSRFYFVHSYFVEPADRNLVAAQCDYGETFACALTHDNLFAVQFHPEKSQHAGLTLLRNFLCWSPR